MPFKNYGELIKMASKNPSKAKSLVSRAQQGNDPVVDSDNPGYPSGPGPRAGSKTGSKADPEKLTMRMQAIKNRQKLSSYKPSKKNPREQISAARSKYNEAIGRRMSQQGSETEDKIITKRKTAGY